MYNFDTDFTWTQKLACPAIRKKEFFTATKSLRIGLFH